MEATPFTPQEIEALRRVAKRERPSSLKSRARSIATSIGKREAKIDILQGQGALHILDFPNDTFSEIIRSTEKLHDLTNDLLVVLREIASIHETNNEETK